MTRDEIELGSPASTHGIDSAVTLAGAMRQKPLHELDCIGSACDRRATYLDGRECTHRRGNGYVIQGVELFGRSAPVEDVWFVPEFPVPGLDFRLSISFDAVPDHLEDELTPLRIVIRRQAPKRSFIWLVLRRASGEREVCFGRDHRRRCEP